MAENKLVNASSVKLSGLFMTEAVLECKCRCDISSVLFLTHHARDLTLIKKFVIRGKKCERDWDEH